MHDILQLGERLNRTLLGLLIIILAVSACSPAKPDQNGELKVVATTTIVGDIVGQIGGEQIDLTVLLPVGSDLHSFQATPMDIAAISDADVVFINCLGLEEFISDFLENAGIDSVIVSLSEEIPNLHENEEGDHHDEDEDADHHDSEYDPHVWLNPNNIPYWAEKIEEELSAMDPDNGEFYQKNSSDYLAELRDLDVWIRDLMGQIPAEQRVMVADHHAWGYFAEAYGFELIGTIIPGYSTLAEASAGELAELEELIEEFNVRTIFIGNSINPSLANRIAKDTGIEIISLYIGSLSGNDGPATTYVDMMRHNVGQIIDAIIGEIGG